MERESLMGHLISRFYQHPENLATESLKFILDGSSSARESFLRFVGDKSGGDISGVEWFRTQSGQEGAGVTDMEGVDGQNRTILILEAKFWAGLTDNQPGAYLRRLPSDINGLVLFVAPERRFVTLWSELVRRTQAEFPTEPGIDSGVSRVLHIAGGHRLALISWQSVLVYVLRELEAKGEKQAASDVGQLLGLCLRMDADAFMPLRSEELASIHGRRIYDYIGIIKDVADSLKGKGVVSTKGLKWTSNTPGVDGQYMSVPDFGLYLQFNPHITPAKKTSCL